MRFFLFLLLIGSNCPFISAQFFLNGSARITEDSCFQLTNETNSDVGSIWYPDKIDLRNSFDLVMDIFLGCRDANGADGIVFGLQPISTTIGEVGGQIGFGGISPALGVEFDTWQNTAYDDPVADHIAIMRDGEIRHNTPDNLAGPVQARANNVNAEICDYLPFRITWDANALTLKVYFDCDLRLTYTGDIVNDIFDGDPFVFYGFTSATGGAVNRHEVCFRFNSFLNQLEDAVMCPGGQILLDLNADGASYEWTPSAGLDDPSAPRVSVAPDTTTTYSVRIFDDCGIPSFDTATIVVAGDSVFFDLGPDTTVCEGEVIAVDVTTPTAVYRWSDTTLSGPLQSLPTPGVYAVTVTRTDTACTAQDRISIDERPFPILDLGPDTVLCNGDLLPVIAVFPEAVARWEDGREFDTLFVSQSGNYPVVLQHPCATLFDRINVLFEPCNDVYLPNAFSPNGDGVNDRFFPSDGGDVTMIHNLSIFDRWGNVVFNQSDFLPNSPAVGWDGNYLGQTAPNGVYIWQLDASFINRSRTLTKGSLNLIR